MGELNKQYVINVMYLFIGTGNLNFTEDCFGIDIRRGFINLESSLESSFELLDISTLLKFPEISYTTFAYN